MTIVDTSNFPPPPASSSVQPNQEETHVSTSMNALAYGVAQTVNPSLMTFTFRADGTTEEQPVRVVDQSGQSWFILRDTLQAMGTSVRTNVAKIDIEQGLGKGYINSIPLQTPGGVQETIIVSEPAVTFLLARSNTERGRQLNQWIHTEVIPSIRKTGSYSLPQASSKDPAVAYRQAKEILVSMMEASKVFGTPEHIAQVETVKIVRKETGVDYQPLLQHAPAQDNIDDLNVMLEPTDIAERLGITFRRGSPDGSAVNRLLDKHGYQDKIDDNWEPTEKGAPYAARHQWTKGSKSGYNYKWRLDLVKELLEHENKQ